MQLDIIPLRKLKFFKTLAYTRNFSKAAKICNVSQPCLSTGIKAIEDLLKGRLFERNTREVSLTKMGKEILPIVEITIARYEHAIDDIYATSRNTQTVIRIAAISTLSIDILPRLLFRYKKKHPDIKIKIVDGISPEVEKLVLNGQCEMGICLLPVENQHIEARQVVSGSLVVYCGQHHRFKKRKSIRWRDLLEEEIVSFQSPSRIYNDIKQVFEQHGVKFQPSATLKYRSSLLGLIANDVVLTILPSLSGDTMLSRGIRAIPLVDPIIERRYVLIRSRTPGYLPSHQKLYEYLIENLEKIDTKFVAYQPIAR